MPLRRTAVVFVLLWAPLALWQCVRTANVCFDGSGWSTTLWTLQFATLAVPLFAARRLARPATHGNSSPDDAAVMMVLIAYVPLTLALRLAEYCGQP